MRSVFGSEKRFFYGWIVVAALIFSGFIIMGVSSSFGVFFTSLEEAFGLSRAVTSSVLSVRMVGSAAAAFLGGWAIDRYGPKIVFSVMGLFIGLSLVLTGLAKETWQIYLTYGVLISVGTGAVYVVITSTVLRWFDQRRGLALGISGMGGGFGTAVLSPLSASLIGGLGWRATMIALGGLAWLVMLPAAWFMKKDPAEVGEFPDGEVPAPVEESEIQIEMLPRIPLGQVVRGQNFWAILLIWLVMAFSGFFINTHIVPHALDIGFSGVEAATILSISGLAMIAGRFIAGLASDRVNPKTVAVIASLVQAAAVLGLVWERQLWMLYLFGLLNGLTFGGFGTSITVLIGRTFRLENIGLILGILESGIFIGGAVGPYLGGLMFDSYGSYSPAFVLMSAVVLVRILLVFMVRPEASPVKSMATA